MRLPEIIGQPIATTTLARAIETNRISHAYLFHGEAGVGKETTARSFVNHLLCETRQACGSCSSCQSLKRNNNPYFHVLETDTSIKIQEIRSLKRDTQFKQEQYNVWLIKDADKMTLQAANSFLKLLEEPPEYVVWILLTTNLASILPTIVSRCQVISFPRLSDDIVRKLLQEKVNNADQSKIDLVARMARGSIGKALDLWDDQFIERRNWVVKQLVKLPTMDIPQVLGLSLTWEEKRDLVIRDLEQMLEWYRDLWCVKTKATDSLHHIDYLHELSVTCEKYTKESLEQITSLIIEMLTYLNRNVRVRFVLGHLLLQMRKGALA